MRCSRWHYIQHRPGRSFKQSKCAAENHLSPPCGGPMSRLNLAFTNLTCSAYSALGPEGPYLINNISKPIFGPWSTCRTGGSGSAPDDIAGQVACISCKCRYQLFDRANLPVEISHDAGISTYPYRFEEVTVDRISNSRDMTRALCVERSFRDSSASAIAPSSL